MPVRPISRKPDQGLIADVLCALGLDYADEHALEYVRSHVVQPKGGIIQSNAITPITALKKTVKPATPKPQPKETQTSKEKLIPRVVPVIRTNGKVVVEILPDVLKPELISEHTKSLLQQIGDELGIKKLNITSGLRPPKRQASTMYDNIKQKGVASQKDMYATTGDAIVNVYVRLNAAGKSKGEIIAAMEAEIISLSEKGLRVSKHCVSEVQYKKLNVIDVSPRTIPQSLHKAMKTKLVNLKAQGLLEKFIIPGEVKGEPAYHLEIPQP